jgi:hypothetical protein
VNVFSPVVQRLHRHENVVTIRQFSSLEQLAHERGLTFLTVGGHYGSSLIAKGIGTAARTIRLLQMLPSFDASIGSVGAPAVFAARVRGKPSLCFLDNDLVTMNLRLSAPFLSRLFVPFAFRNDVLVRLGLDDRTLRYDGFKEDLAVAGYEPDAHFLSRLPFREYVVVRPEALKAEYVPSSATTIVPALLGEFESARVNVLYLARDDTDRSWALGRHNVFVPETAVNGLDACYFARAVLTGSGTLAREAAVLGVPAASFFPGPQLLSVDQEMVRRGWMTHSRDPQALAQGVLFARRRPFERARSVAVLDSVVSRIEEALEEFRAG